MTYRGKHPARVAQVWSVADHKGVRIKLNDGRMFDVLPVSGAPGMPRLGDELATLQADVTGLKVTPYVSNNERVETFDELTGSEQREVTQRGWPRSDFESVVAYARDDAGSLRSWRRFTAAQWGNLMIGSGGVGRMVAKPQVISATQVITAAVGGQTATVETTYDAASLFTKSQVNRVTAVLDMAGPIDSGDLESIKDSIEALHYVNEATVYAGLAGVPSQPVADSEYNPTVASLEHDARVFESFGEAAKEAGRCNASKHAHTGLSAKVESTKGGYRVSFYQSVWNTRYPFHMGYIARPDVVREYD